MTRLGSKHPYLLSPLAGPESFILLSDCCNVGSVDARLGIRLELRRYQFTRQTLDLLCLLMCGWGSQEVITRMLLNCEVRCHRGPLACLRDLPSAN